ESGFGIDLLRHHLFRLGSSGEIVQSARNGVNDTFISAQIAIPEHYETAEEITEDSEKALEKLVKQYFSSRSPATINDFVWWSSMPIGIVRRTIKRLCDAGRLTSIEFEGEQYFLADWQNDVSEVELKQALEVSVSLPAFDEFMISYKQRVEIFAPGVDPYSIMTKNGISWPFKVARARITGRYTESA
ncbi:MAG: crosslink repair DNA glycosylase YcaQ family protein, partial [Arcanobacterium sp.]|nr:crosslink repair DNA glycosylase YcaQ family protein [Arcanobacterium sp.]